VTTIRLPWGAWYGDETRELDVPDRWRVTVAPAPTAPALSDAALRRALAAPIGSPPLRELARGKRSAAIVVDDFTRPTPASVILPLVLDELRAGGIEADAVRILLGFGGHRALGRPELLHKLGPLADDLTVINHTPYEHLVAFGTTTAGTPVFVSRWYAETELRLTIGCVEPHPALGWSGGAKLVVPGLAGIETIAANHRPGHLPRGILGPDDNAMRRDVEEAVRRVGLDHIVNVVIAGRREVVGLFAGDMVDAHRAAARFAERLYQTPVGAPADVALFNAYPKDTELLQANNALNAALSARTALLREGGVAVVATAASEGPGYHALYQPGARYYERPAHRYVADRPVTVYCPHGRAVDLPPSFPAGTALHRGWPDVVRWVEARVGRKPSLTVFTEGPLQIPVAAGRHEHAGVEGSVPFVDSRTR
jgi:nickel-dependent lactate racemase